MDSVTVESLVQLGFSPTEAKVYFTMVSEEKMNGYQIAKALRISRSSVYAALENLLEKGAIFSVPGQTSEYSVVEPDRLIDRITENYKKNGEIAKNLLKQISLKKRASNYFCNIQGQQKLIDEINLMIECANREIIIDSAMDLKPFVENLKSAKERGVRIILFSWVNLELYNLDIEFYCNDISHEKGVELRFLMVCDNISCIICSNDRNEFIPYSKYFTEVKELPAEDSDFIGLKSDNRLFVSLIQEHIHFDIYLNKLRIKNGGEIITKDILCNTLMETGN